MTTPVHLYIQGAHFIGPPHTEVAAALREARRIVKSGIDGYALVDWPQHHDAVLFYPSNRHGDISIMWQSTQAPLPDHLLTF